MAVDDLDKFCRSCGHGTDDSIDYHTYYRSFIKDNDDRQLLLWFMKGTGIAFQQEIKEIKEKVDLMYQKLFPHSVGELRKELDILFNEKEEHNEEKLVEKIPEKSPEIKVEKKEEHGEEKLVEKIPEKSPEIKVEKKEEHGEEKLVEKIPEKSPEIKVKKKEEHGEEKLVEKIPEKSPEIKVKKKEEHGEEKADWPWPEGGTEETSRKQDEIYVPQEADDKLNMLLQDGGEPRRAVQYLIDKYRKNGEKVGGNIGNNKSDNTSFVDNSAGHGIAIVPSEDVVRVGHIRGKGKKKGERYKMYAVAIDPFVQDILNDIKCSKDGMIRVRSSDIARKMGEKFVDKQPITIYGGLKYTLFDYNIVVEMGTLKAIDPITRKNIKILKMRMKSANDVLPPSMLGRRGDTR
jgi:hypothetical protein